MTPMQRLIIANKSDDQLVSDINFYYKKHCAIPRLMVSTKISSSKRIQAHIEEQQKRLIKKSLER